MHILIIEDDMSLAEVLKSSLEKEGHTVTSCFCLRDGALFVREHLAEIDLVVTDVSLPIYSKEPTSWGSGLDIAREILHRGDGTTPKPLYVHSSEPKDRGVDIQQWLRGKYPTAVFKLKQWDATVTTQQVIDFIDSLTPEVL